MKSPSRSVLSSVAACSLVSLGALGLPSFAAAQTAERTIFLAPSRVPGAGLNVTWHPVFRQYYAAGPGCCDPFAGAIYVFSETGAELQANTAIPHDLRSINYNQNTGKLEVVTFTARDGGVGNGLQQGLFDAALDAAGLTTGTTAELLPSLPGLLGRQTMPVYDALRDEFYSFSNTNLLRRVSRADGSLLGTITLDTDAAGTPAPLTTWFGIGFDAANDYLLVSGYETEKVYRFRLDGSFVDAWNVDIDVQQFYGGTSFVNGQLFVYDNARSGWQGYLLDASCPADFNADGFVDFFDFDDFVACFEGSPCPPGSSPDFNNDGFVDFFDFDDFVTAFETGC